MLNSFQTYPFEKLSLLLEGIQTEAENVVDLTIGEPQFETPKPIQEALQNSTHLLRKYPKSAGESSLKDAQINFIKTRFDLSLAPHQLIPTFGTREVLFNFPHFLLSNKSDAHIAYPNPFYQIYEGGAIGAKAQIILMDLTKENQFKPSLTQSDLQKVNLVILNSPNNPTGSILTLEELCTWVELALKYDFIILSDECYSEIYQDTPPPSILEACLQVQNTSFDNILALNSISKRSCAPGLRSGFIAGDSKLLEAYQLYRTYIGCAIPLPLQEAAKVAWNLSSEPTRLLYAQNLKIAQDIFPQTQISPYTFYVWLEVGDELSFTTMLYRDYGIKVLPGSFLGRNGAGKGFVRLALVYPPSMISIALQKIQYALKHFKEDK
ncbi:succinyldiaminopimelate transaminase [Helicobacter pametensis]|uniref:succinyldiaminopimelate transaminase n=1 Tax=Helicobacter pametensis TaxID=95149 RepID=UPI000480F1CF|nr:succinyldiaminopimelate transaminase [Helicobacter pametensis]